MPDTAKIQKLEAELTVVVNRYIDVEKMTTEDVYGALCGVGFRVVKASQPAEAMGAGDSKILENLNFEKPN